MLEFARCGNRHCAQSEYESGTAEYSKAGGGINRTAREVEPLLTSLRARLPEGRSIIAAGDA